jgi:serine/threonine protein kinase/Tol biopolymer transport system component
MAEPSSESFETPEVTATVVRPLAGGDQLGSYRILEAIGAGGMGQVYRARDERLNRTVAIKTLPPDRVSDPEWRKRFVREARAASALNHPNIITFYDLASAGDREFLVMEYVAGKALDREIPKHGLPLKIAVAYATQIAGALAAAHAAGVFHRDLKPGNVMVTESGSVKVLDFGLAKMSPAVAASGETESVSQAGAILGTAAYMSPEQAEGGKVDARSDIFSFGLVLYEMLSGKRAFQRTTIMSTLAAIVRDEAPPMDVSLPAELRQIVRRCLRKEPGRRWQHMADVKVALEELLDQPAAITGVEPRPGRHFTWLVALGSTVLASAAVLWFLTRPAAEPPLDLVPLTSFTGSELDPRISPDGRQVVYTWDGEKADNFDIYVQLIGPGTPLRLTTDPGDDFTPAWSPDGRTLAFLRDQTAGRPTGPPPARMGDSNKWQVLTVPALGGPERLVAEVAAVNWRNKGFFGPYLAWTPGGKSLVVVDRGARGQPYGLFLLSLDSGEKRRLTIPPADIHGDNGPAFSPDGRSLAFRRIIANHISDIFVLPLAADFSPAGEPRSLTTHAFAASPAWTPDGREVVFSDGAFGNPRLWRKPAERDGAARQILAAGEGASFPSISGGSAGVAPRLVFYRWSWDTNLWRAPVSGHEPPVRLVASTRRDSDPSYSPDGKMIAFTSDRSGRHEIWASRSDGSQPTQLTTMGKAFHASWSPDSAQVAFVSSAEGNQEIYVVRASGGSPKRLTNHPARDLSPSWSRDTKWIYFASSRSGGTEVWRMPAQGGEPDQVTTNGGTFPSESPDGSCLYYWRDGSLWRRRLPGGQDEKVVTGLIDRYDVGAGTIYFVRETGAGGGLGIHALDLKTGTTRTVVNVPGLLLWGLSLPPDERYVLYFQSDQDTSDVMMLENFR